MSGARCRSPAFPARDSSAISGGTSSLILVSFSMSYALAQVGIDEIRLAEQRLLAILVAEDEKMAHIEQRGIEWLDHADEIGELMDVVALQRPRKSEPRPADERNLLAQIVEIGDVVEHQIQARAAPVRRKYLRRRPVDRHGDRIDQRKDRFRDPPLQKMAVRHADEQHPIFVE